jgi:hypothetical protein
LVTKEMFMTSSMFGGADYGNKVLIHNIQGIVCNLYIPPVL